MPEKEPQFNQGEAEEKKAEAPENDEDKNWEIRLYNADGTEKKEPKKRILLWGKLKELLENVNLSDEEAKEYAEKFLDLKNKKTSVIIHKFSADVLEYNILARILREGILSHEFAKRAKLPKLGLGDDPVLQSKYGMDNISVYDSDMLAKAEGTASEDSAIENAFYYGMGEDYCGIVIDKKLSTPENTVPLFVPR